MARLNDAMISSSDESQAENSDEYEESEESLLLVQALRALCECVIVRDMRIILQAHVIGN